MAKLFIIGFVLISILSEKSCSSEETTVVELTTEAKSIVLEKSAHNNTQCAENCSKKYGEFFICAEGKCICPPALNFHDGNCFPKRSLNESCKSSVSCQHIGSAICRGSKCSCAVDFVQENNKCIKSKVKQRGHEVKPNSNHEQNTVTTNVDSDNPYKVLDFKTDLVLECEVSGVNFVVTWLKDEEPIDKEISRIEQKTTEKGSKLTVKRPMAENDAGNYTCKVVVTSSKSNGTEVRKVIPVIVRPNLKLPPSSTAIEGEKMELLCSVVGRPIPFITWKYGNETYDRSSDRIELLEDPVKKIPNAILKIKETRMDDHGLYTCVGVSDYGNSTSATTVRVKDKLAALWPFLGICAEVFVLCAIILIYEKKRNKTELEESDTDQSPEQKNTPEHGKDSVRQRK